MIKYSVRKPFTVIVAVIVIMLIGAVALLRMETSLLPDMDLPYMVVITTCPGYTPEKMEETVTKPLEGTLGTVSGVENISSISGENYSAITMEFQNGTEMDSAMVKVSSAVNQTLPYLPEEAGTPNILEISMDRLATIYAAVSYDGKNIYELSDFAKKEVAPALERISGVASVELQGLLTQSIEVRLNQDKIDECNEKILVETNRKLSDAEEDLLDAEEELADAKEDLDDKEQKLKDSESTLKNKQDSTTKDLTDAALALDQAEASVAAYSANLTALNASKTALEAEKQAYVDNQIAQKLGETDQLFSGVKQLVQGLEVAGEAVGISMSDQGLKSSKLPDSTAAVISNPSLLDNFKAQVGVLNSAAFQGLLDQIAMQASAMGDNSFSKLAKNVKKVGGAAGQAAGALTFDNLKQMYDIVNTRIPQIDTELANLLIEIQAAEEVLRQVQEQAVDLDEKYREAEAGKISAAAGFGAASAEISAGKTGIEAGRTQLDDATDQLKEARDQFEESKKTILKTANLDQLLTLSALSNLIYAQNFAMPAGYLDDEEDDQWLLKVGENYDSAEDIEDMVLTNIENVGDIRVIDVADVTWIDNSGEAYTKVNGEEGVLLSVYKGSTAGTSKVSSDVAEEIQELEEKYEGLHIITLLDQGEYIRVVISSIFKSMMIGAGLAVLILAIFLFDIRPTLVVAFSIPFSVLTALVVMYFTGVSLNMMSLFGLSLAVGMLVDNSIVVIENIYRLRYKGLSAPDAAVHGGRQVAGAIIASTLTTICVFFPVVFTEGLVRQLMLPFSLSITYALVASLIVAMTVVPVMGTGLLRKAAPRQHKVFDKIQDFYGVILRFCLRFKIVPLGIATGLLALTLYLVFQMGIVLLPEAGSKQIQLTATIPEEDDQETAYKKADQIIAACLSVPEVSYIGALDGGDATGMGSVFGSSDSDYHDISAYIIPSEDCDTITELNKLVDDLNLATENIDAEVEASNSMMGEMQAFLGSGLELNLLGDDMEELTRTSEEIMDMIAEIPGFTSIENGMDDVKPELHLLIDKDKARRFGTTEAQLYQLITENLETEKTAVTITVNKQDCDVIIVNENDALNRDNLLKLTFEETIKKDDGSTETREHTLRQVARVEEGVGLSQVLRTDGNREITVTAGVEDGYFVMLLRRTLEQKLKDFPFPEGISWSFGGELENTIDMLSQMLLLMGVGAILIYLVMVAQFQSLLGPFIVIFTVPLAFTGGLIGMLIYGSQLSLVALMGFLVLMGTVVNNGIVFVDYTNKLRLYGLEKREALVETGKTRMRPILMTALTTILAMLAMVFSQDPGNDMSKDMAVVVAAGLLYATLMTLFIVPVMYDILYRKQPKKVEISEIADELDGDIY